MPPTEPPAPRTQDLLDEAWDAMRTAHDALEASEDALDQADSLLVDAFALDARGRLDAQAVAQARLDARRARSLLASALDRVGA